MERSESAAFRETRYPVRRRIGATAFCPDPQSRSEKRGLERREEHCMVDKKKEQQPGEGHLSSSPISERERGSGTAGGARQQKANWCDCGVGQ